MGAPYNHHATAVQKVMAQKLNDKRPREKEGCITALFEWIRITLQSPPQRQIKFEKDLPLFMFPYSKRKMDVGFYNLFVFVKEDKNVMHEK